MHEFKSHRAKSFQAGTFYSGHPREEHLIRGISLCIVIGVFVFASGCASSGSNYDDKKVEGIQNNVTTEAQLIEAFGEPTSRVTSANGSSQLTWSYNQMKADKRQFIPYAGLFWAGNTSSAGKSLHVTLQNGIVTDYTSSTGGMDTRQGTQSVPK